MNITKYKPALGALTFLLILTFSAISFAQTNEEKLAAANKSYDEAFVLFNQGTAESYRAALGKFQVASRLFEETSYGEEKAGISFLVSGLISDNLT